MESYTCPTLWSWHFSPDAGRLVFLLDTAVQSFLGDLHHFSVLDKGAESRREDKNH